MARLILTLLGGFQARSASRRAVAGPGKKVRALLAYLALPAGQAHPREKLAALLWGESGESQARDSLRQALAALRKALPATRPPCLLITSDTVALNPAAVEVDVATFERRIAAGTPKALAQAAALYRGDLLDGIHVSTAPFEEWLLSEQTRLRELALQTLGRLLTHQAAAGSPERTIETAGRLLALDPLQEAAHRALMRLHAGQGRWSAALRQYQLCVGVLQRELGVEPEAETKRLYRELLRQRTGPPPAADLAASGSLREAPRAARRDVPTRGTRFVGRQAERARLTRALDEAGRGRGKVAAVLGEGGIGKTRLLEELAADAARRGGRVLWGRAYESEQILPFGPWTDALRSGQVSEDAARLEGFSPMWRAELARLLPELGGPAAPPSTAPDSVRRLFEAVTQLVGCLAARQPLLFVLEDLHWADETSLRLLSSLGRRLRVWPSLLVASAREEEVAAVPALRRALRELGREGALVEVTLSPLSRPQTLDLVRALARTGSPAAALDRLGEKVWAVSEGNPFMVVETMRARREGETPTGSRRLNLPQRVREVIAGRLERLSERSRQLAAVAAVIGREFDVALLPRAAGVGARRVAAGVEELVQRRVLHAVGERFDFTHDQIRDVAYTQLLPPLRALLHRRVGAALEALHATSLEPHYAALAFHYREGGVWPKALEYLRQAGTQAMDRGAYREAAVCFEQALAVVEHLGGAPEAAQSALELRLGLRNALLPLGDQVRMLDNLREAEALAERLGDRRRLGWVLSYLALEVRRHGDAERAIELAERVLAIAGALDDVGLRVIAGIRLGQASHSLGRYAEAIDALRTTVAALAGDRRREQYGLPAPPAVIARTWLAWCLAERGEFGEGERHAEEGLAIAEEVDQPYPLAAACFGLGLLRLRRGDVDGAIRVLERGMALCQVREIPVFLAWTASALACVYILAGQSERARPLLAPPLEADILTKAAQEAFPFLWLGEAHLLVGRLDEAGKRARQALDLARDRRERGHEAYALRLQAEVAARRDPPGAAEAENLYRQAVAAAEELGMRPLGAHCHLGLGKLYGRTGDRPKAEDHLTRAATMYRGMDMGFWLQKAEAGGTAP